MRVKIALLTVLVLILNSVFCYADVSSPTVPNSVYNHLRTEFEYDDKTDTYYFPINDIDKLDKEGTKSATVAVSGAVISSVLALAVKSGLEFATTNSLSEFVSRFFMLEGISDVVSGLNDVVKNSAGGVLKFSSSLLDSVRSKFSEIISQDKVSSVYIGGRRIPLLNMGSHVVRPDQYARYIFETSTLPRLCIDGSTVTTTWSYSDSEIYLPSNTALGNFSVRSRLYRSGTNSSAYTDDIQILIKKTGGSYSSLNGSYTAVEFPKDTLIPGFKAYAIPFLEKGTTNYLVGMVVAVYSTVTGYLSDVKSIVTTTNIPTSHLTSSSLPVIGEAWSSGSIGGGGSLDISIPKDTNILINKLPTDIVSTPTYEIWTPGTTVVVPNIETGTDSPPVDDVLPPIAEETPGDSDTGTDVPDSDGSTSISWDWLKELLNKLLEMIQTIIDWLTNFWTNLLEFIKSLFVPDENYFVDEFSNVTEKLEEKIPSVDINKLEDLAVNEFAFEDIYADFFGVRCLVVRGSVINNVISWARPIIQGLIALFLLLFNYNQIYFLIRGTSLLGSSNTLGNMNNNKIGGKK